MEIKAKILRICSDILLFLGKHNYRLELKHGRFAPKYPQIKLKWVVPGSDFHNISATLIPMLHQNDSDNHLNALSANLGLQNTQSRN